MTVMKVKPWGEGQGDFVLIDEADFNPDFHEKMEGAPQGGKQTVEQIREELTALGVEFDPSTGKKELRELLELAKA